MLIIVIESQHLHTHDETGRAGPGGGPGGGGRPGEPDVHDEHPVLKAKLSKADKCWKTEEYVVVQECDRCTGNNNTLDNKV